MEREISEKEQKIIDLYADLKGYDKRYVTLVYKASTLFNMLHNPASKLWTQDTIFLLENYSICLELAEETINQFITSYCMQYQIKELTDDDYESLNQMLFVEDTLCERR